jgi:hypothetical protein
MGVPLSFIVDSKNQLNFQSSDWSAIFVEDWSANLGGGLHRFPQIIKPTVGFRCQQTKRCGRLSQIIIKNKI